MKKKSLLIILLLIAIVNILSAKEKILVGTVQSAPFVIKGENNTYSGISFELWNKISHNLNLDYTIVEYSSIQEMLDALENNEIDITVYSLSINTERLEKFGFSQPYWITTSSILSKKSDTAWYSFIFAIFNSKFMTLLTWLFIIILALGIIIWFVEHKKNDLITSDKTGVFNCFYFIIITLTTMGFGDIVPKTKKGKSFVMLLGIISYIASGLFVGSISSQLTLDNINDHQIENIVELRKLKTASVSETYSSEFLNRSDIRHLPYTSLKECIKDIQKGELDCIFYDTEQLKYNVKENKILDYQISKKTFSNQMYGFCSSKNFNFRKINIEIMKITNTTEWKKYTDNLLN